MVAEFLLCSEWIETSLALRCFHPSLLSLAWIDCNKTRIRHRVGYVESRNVYKPSWEGHWELWPLSGFATQRVWVSELKGYKYPLSFFNLDFSTITTTSPVLPFPVQEYRHFPLCFWINTSEKKTCLALNAMMWEWLVHLYAPNATVMAEPREYLKIFLGRKTGRYSPTPLS